MFSIYHIPTFVHKDGSIGKIGCTTRPTERVLEQGYSKFEILEEHSCIDTASIREIELQKEYGYKVDTIPYWKVYKQREQTRSLEASIKGGKTMGNIHKKNNTGICGLTKEQRIKYGKLGAIAQKIEDKVKGGKIAGKLNKDKGKITLMINKNTNEVIKEFPSLATAARFLGKRENKIRAVISGEKYRHTAYGYKWKYKD